VNRDIAGVERGCVECCYGRKGPVVDDIVLETEADGLEEGADGTMDEVDMGLAMEDKAWAPPRYLGHIRRATSLAEGTGNNCHCSLLRCLQY
jgi:hypothetical protein